MPEVFVKSFTHLKGRPKADRALAMLQRVASLVKPIMRKHGWVLPVLTEFFPDSPNLVGLNVNGGEKILLRLRPPSAPDSFYDEEQVVLVMLHELTHNVHGPHDEKFYKFLAGLEDEYEALRRSGYSGEGFHSTGHRLGGNTPHNLPPHLTRLKALEAAEKRRKIGSLMGGPRRLGGRTDATRGMTPRELAAQAAERRANDEKACGSGATAQREAEKAAKESIVIDLTGDSDDDTDMPVEVRSAGSSESRDSNVEPGTNARSRSPAVVAEPSRPSKSTPSANPIPTSKQNAERKTVQPSTKEWACPICTLLNGASALQCDACLSERPLDRTAGWTCAFCGESGMNPEFWTCRSCGSMKLRS